MTFVVTEPCIKCKFTDCVEACPVDCFREGENMLVIDPDECIDCGVCVPECPVDAIVPDTSEKAGSWLKLNEEFSRKGMWPQIMYRIPPLEEAEEYRLQTGKKALLSLKPGEGN